MWQLCELLYTCYLLTYSLRTLNMSFHRTYTCSNTSSICHMQHKAPATVHDGLLHPHLRHCSSPASAGWQVTPYHSTRRTAASTPQTLLVASICGPPAAISCSYRDTGLPCSAVRPFLADRAAWNSLPDYLRDPSRSFDSFRRDLKTLLISFY